MRGWHREPQRHALAARGIRSRGLHDPITKKIIRDRPSRFYRFVNDLNNLSRILNTGRLLKRSYGVYGGLTTNDQLYQLGTIRIEFDSEKLLKDNDLFKLHYDSKFLDEHDHLKMRIISPSPGIDIDDLSAGDLLYLEYEQEYYSTKIVRIKPEMIRSIAIYYASDKEAEFYLPTIELTENFIEEHIPLEYRPKIKLIPSDEDFILNYLF